MAAPLNAALPADVVNILIVDDLPEKLLVFRSVLEELQQNLVLVRSGREALRQLLEQDFAVVLLDVNMPDIDGFETAAMIRKYKKTANTPIIFITAYVDEIQTAHGYALGAVDYITTPVVPEILRSKVRVFVDLYRMHRQLRQWADERESLARAEAARAAAEAAQRRADFLSEVSNALTRSLDSGSIVQRLLRVAVPALADVAAVVLLDEGSGDSQTIDAAQLQGATVQALAAPPSGSLPAEAGHVEIRLPQSLLKVIQHTLRSGEVRTLDGAALGAMTLRDAEFVEGYPLATAGNGLALAVKALMVLPLHVRGGIAGALLLGRSGENRGYGDLALAKEVTSRAGIALENSLLYREISNGDRRKNEFLAMLAHELRNPLAPIRNAVHIIEQLQLSDPTLDWAAQIIGNQVTHIARIVDDLLDVARIARGKVELRQERVALASIVHHSLETSRPHIDARNQSLRVDVPLEPLFVRGDVVRLAQVLSNLLNNASKYTPAGGHIWLSAKGVGEVVSICVRDDGAGIAAELLPDIFELFRQGAQSMDRAQGGLGVGLTLVKQLVELHGGSVQATSAGVGHGAEFIVRLPLCEIEQNQSTPLPSGPDSPTHAARRVLIVDDQKSSADSLRRIFEMKECVAEVAYDGPSALRAAATFKPDVILLDIGLPGMDGFEVAAELKKIPVLNDILLIALTGYGQSEDVQRALAVGFHVHLVKPVDIAHLFAVIAGHSGARSGGLHIVRQNG